MYWPNGVPRVYAVNGPGPPVTVHGEEEAEAADGRETERQGSFDSSTRRARNRNAWAREPLIGLCVSRNGHFFATMTESSIAVWQTKVI